MKHRVPREYPGYEQKAYTSTTVKLLTSPDRAFEMGFLEIFYTKFFPGNVDYRMIGCQSQDFQGETAGTRGPSIRGFRKWSIPLL